MSLPSSSAGSTHPGQLKVATNPQGLGDGDTEPPVLAVRRERPSWRRLPVALRRFLILVVIVGIWQAYTSLGHVSQLLFSSPVDVAKAFFTGWSSGTLASSTELTMKVLVIGMVIGMVAAAFFTTLAVWTKFGEDLLTLLTSMINPLPSIAILPLAILWFGLNTQALVFVVANAVTWPIAINVSIGFRTVNPTILAVGRNIGLNRWRQITDVLMPAALPHTVAGLKTAWAFGWRTIIAAELVFGVAGGKGGLGYFINISRYYLRIPDVFAGLVTIAIIGILIDLVFTWIERRTVVRWGMKA